jgi:hypothetical protein
MTSVIAVATTDVPSSVKVSTSEADSSAPSNRTMTITMAARDLEFNMRGPDIPYTNVFIATGVEAGTHKIYFDMVNLHFSIITQSKDAGSSNITYQILKNP